MKGHRLIFWILVTAALGSVSVAQRPRAPVLDEYFGVGENPPSHPSRKMVPLPLAVAKLLLQTEEAKDSLLYVPATQKKLDPAQLFSAQEAHLSPTDKRDLVVIGIGPMTGADNDWFWIVSNPDSGPQVIGFMNGYSIAVMQSHTNGFRDIISAWSSPSETDEHIYHFDGKEYKLWKSSSTPIPPR